MFMEANGWIGILITKHNYIVYQKIKFIVVVHYVPLKLKMLDLNILI